MICWICNEKEANTAEHKFKSSILKRMYGKQFNSEIMYESGAKELRLEGPNNKKVKFAKVICETCNNSVTASHDKAFDKLIEWSNLNYEILKSNEFIDFELIYGNDWFDQKRNLLKYMAKHAGCKIVTGEQSHDISELSNLIFENVNTNSFQIKFILKEGFHFIDILLKQKGSDGLKFISNSPTVFYKTIENETVYFGGMTTYNWLTIAWVHTQNKYQTKFDGFSKRIEDLSIFHFDELPEIQLNDNWFNIIDNHIIQTHQDQISFYTKNFILEF